MSEDIGKSIIAAAPVAAPTTVSDLIRRIIDASINGVAGVPGAKTIAGDHLVKYGDVERAINQIVLEHTILSGAQGFATNVGGIAVAIVGAPASIVGLAVIHSRMVACIAHLRGYNIDDTRVRHAIMTTLLGKKIVDDLVGKGDLPGTPLVVATAPAIDPRLEATIAGRVTTALASSTGGRQVINIVLKRIPLVGGGVGAVTDGWNTRAIGTYAREQFVSRRRIEA